MQKRLSLIRFGNEQKEMTGNMFDNKILKKKNMNIEYVNITVPLFSDKEL